MATSEAAVVESVRRACVAGDGVDPFDEADALAWEHRGASGAALTTEDDGFALVRAGALVLAVAPQARGVGLGTRLAAAAGDARTAWSHGDHPAAAALARRLGWRRTRELWMMRRPTAEPLPRLDVPEGVTLRGFKDGDVEDVLAVNAAAFARHPEQGALNLAGFEERVAEPWWDPAGLLLAVDEDGVLLGFHWTKQRDAQLGEVYVVGVSPAAQGRGVGRLVTLAGLHHLVGLGVEEILLFVESENTAAVRLYSGLGFEHAATDTHAHYSR